MAKIFLLALVRTKRSLSTKNEGCSSYDRGASPPEQRRKKERKKEEVQNGTLANFSLQASVWFWTPERYS